jgi:hypothetical protein
LTLSSDFHRRQVECRVVVHKELNMEKKAADGNEHFSKPSSFEEHFNLTVSMV